jgi:hypothetical protein
MRQDVTLELGIIDGIVRTFPCLCLGIMFGAPLAPLEISHRAVGRILACSAQVGEELWASGFEVRTGFPVPFG